MLLPVICPTDDTFVVKPNASNEFLMTFKDSQTGATLDVPQAAINSSQTHQIHQRSCRTATIWTVLQTVQVATQDYSYLDSKVI